MRLQSIELDQVGVFTDPVQINGIGPGLNVLAGANELGKSTILRGLTALFTEQHRASKQSIRNLRPYSGGAPRLVCIYEQDGHSWRLEKRYLSAQMALLERLDGSDRCQGADAENRLTELMGEGSDFSASLPLLWVEQGARSFEVPVLTDAARQSLGQLLSAQAENTSGVGAAQAVLLAVEAELGQLVTEKTGKARKNSAYDKLLTERKQLTETLVEAKRKASDAEQRLARLTELQQTSAELQDPNVQAGLEAQIYDHEQRLRSAEGARLKLQQLSERLAFLDNQKKQREATLSDYDEGLKELEAIGAAMSSADQELSAIAARRSVVGDRLQGIEAEIGSLVERNANLRSLVEQHRQADEQANRRLRFLHLARQCDRLNAISKETAEIDLELVELHWPDNAIVKLRSARGNLDQALARQTASAPRLRVAYQPGRRSGFKMEGADIPDGAEIAISEAMVIEIEGIGRIDVLPNESGELGAVKQDLEAASEAFAACLGVMGAVDADDAEAREDRRNELLQARRVLRSEHQVIAPEGEAKLASELTQLQSVEDDDWNATSPDPASVRDDCVADISVDQLMAELSSVETERGQAMSRMEALKAERTTVDQRSAEIATELRIRRTRHDELRIKYANDDAGVDQRDELVKLVTAAEQQLNVAVRERLAVQEVVLTEAASLDLNQSLLVLKSRLKSRAEQQAAVIQEMRHIEGMLARDFEDGAGDQVNELRGRVEELDGRIRDSEEHIAALRLLMEYLRSETTRRRDAIARPLALRLGSLAAKVWPDVEIPLNSDLSVDGLVRQGLQEETDRVSSGTREQVAVMARLAYADLLAEGREPLPVILDDPLVYSDDKRLESLFETMADAAQAHQIIVLTCHERAFEPLVTRFNATRLSIQQHSSGQAT